MFGDLVIDQLTLSYGCFHIFWFSHVLTSSNALCSICSPGVLLVEVSKGSSGRKRLSELLNQKKK